jgi:hypothetical protein
MILPNKYIPVDDTLPALGKILYEKLRFPQPLSRLWFKVETNQAIGTYERFVYTLDFLYAVGLIDFENGIVKRK